jgi:hypothetical protein
VGGWGGDVDLEGDAVPTRLVYQPVKDQLGLGALREIGRSTGSLADFHRGENQGTELRCDQLAIRKLRGGDNAHVCERAIPIIATYRLEDVVAEAVKNQLSLVNLDAMK